MLAVNIKFNTRQAQRVVTRVSQRLPEETVNSLNDFSNVVVKKLKRNLMNDTRPITPDRQRAKTLIKSKKLSKTKIGIMMPRSLVLLDAMKPHYVSLKRGRNIVGWTKRNFGSAQVSGRSHVVRGVRGGVSGSLYVTPHKFVQLSLNQSRNFLPNELRKGIKKAFKGYSS